MLIDHSLSWKPGTGGHKKKNGLQMCARRGRLVRHFIGVFYCPACMSGIVATIMNIINLIHTPGGKMAAPHSQREHEKKKCLPAQQPASYLEDQFVCLSVFVCVCDGG